MTMGFEDREDPPEEGLMRKVQSLLSESVENFLVLGSSSQPCSLNNVEIMQGNIYAIIGHVELWLEVQKSRMINAKLDKYDNDSEKEQDRQDEKDEKGF